MQKLKVSYSFDYLREVFNYILIPVFIVLLIVIIGLFIYSKKEKDHDSEKYNYTINFWSYLMCIILSAALFAIALSFVVSLHNSIAGRPVDKSNLIYLVYLSPIVPFVFLVSTGIHWIRMFLAYKGQKREENNSQKELEETESDEPQNSSMTVSNDEENTDSEKNIVPIAVTPQQQVEDEEEEEEVQTPETITKDSSDNNNDIEESSNNEEKENIEEMESDVVSANIENTDLQKNIIPIAVTPQQVEEDHEYLNEDNQDNYNENNELEENDDQKEKASEEKDIEMLDID